MDNRAQIIRQTVANYLENVLPEPELLGLGTGIRGKVRTSYTINTKKYGEVLAMITSDRVSAFDVILDRAIPFKGVVLNAIAEHSFHQLENIVDTAILFSPHPRIVIQRKLQNVGIECVMRGYLWGSMANEYEAGKREKSGNFLQEELLRYQQLPKPLFTPTTKAEKGHDEDIVFPEMVRILHTRLNLNGNNCLEYAQKIQKICQKLYHSGAEKAKEKGLLLLDTKYEFGIYPNDPDQKLFLIDEVHTPDSSRYVEQTEWQTKFPQIQAEMQIGKYSTVTALLQQRPELKIKEWSKQVVRDVLLEQGYDGRSGNPPSLTDTQIIETAARYIEIYEQLTRKEFDFAYFSQPFNEETIVKYLKNI